MTKQGHSSNKVDLTRKRIISAAEKIFADKGFRAMTLRDVTKEAKVNLAAVNYHFGSKTKLMHAVIYNRFAPINEERMRRLNALKTEHGGGVIPLRDIFAALIDPLFEAAVHKQPKKDNILMRIIGRAFTEPADFMCQMHKDFFKELCLRFISEIQEACPDLSKDEIHFRFFFSVSTMLGSIIEKSRFETLSNRSLHPSDLPAIAERLTSFIVAGFEQK